VRLGRLRAGEWTALAGALALLVLLPLRWYALNGPAGGGRPSETGLGGLGWLVVLVVALAVLLALALVAATAAERSPTAPMALAVLTVPVGALAVLVLAARLVAEPGLGVEAPDARVDLRWPAWLAPLAAGLLVAGAWRAMADERTDTPEARAQTERVLRVRGTPRPAPPRRAGVSAPADPAPGAE
jgi:hypothetical protein